MLVISDQRRVRASGPDAVEVEPERMTASVYDAVAGRVTANGFTPADAPSNRRVTNASSGSLLPPDEALFSQMHAPPRYEEDGLYSADTHPASYQQLPGSDMVKAVHAYASDFYSASLGSRARGDWKSMDETALLAIGVLMEEAAADILGKTGDLAFVEGEDDDPRNMPQAWNGSRWTRSVVRISTSPNDSPAVDPERSPSLDSGESPMTADANQKLQQFKTSRC
ncbi:hypothetical protein GTA08_BOTSDO03050 [Neofusicoccum parvum]|nr:hypothetical protein GTA08_BOTSDO03050 [Neofusicoccum parvum]